MILSSPRWALRKFLESVRKFLEYVRNFLESVRKFLESVRKFLEYVRKFLKSTASLACDGPWFLFLIISYYSTGPAIVQGCVQRFYLHYSGHLHYS